MSWEEGSQGSRTEDIHINEYINSKKGFLEEREAKILLYKFMRENVSFTTDLISGIKLFPFQHMAIKAMFETDYFMGVWSRGMSKSFTTGIYAFLDAIMHQGVEIGILSKSFRQAKMIFKKIEDIAAKPEANFLAQCITKKSKSNDEWLMEIGSSRIRALPLGDGEKLRGFRFHRIIIDEFLLMPERIYNEVIVPFLSVVENPTQREDLYNLETEMISQGKMKEEDRYVWPNNKLIMLSSASYKFEYMYKLYSQFNDLIQKGGQKSSDAHRVIMQFSYDCAPKQLYDQNLIDQAKSTMSQSQFEREFGAVFTDDSSGYFKTSRMADCSIRDGESPSVEVKGEVGAKYLLAFDPSWAESESSDDFAMSVFKLNDKTQQSVLVHSYALSGTNLKQHISYLDYILTNFNIVCIVGDYNGGLQFINAVNESSLFKKKKRKIKLLTSAFDKQQDYYDDIKQAKQEYNIEGGCICYLRKPTSAWIRVANELLQANFDHKRIWFGARALDDAYKEQVRKKIPIEKLKFLRTADADAKQSNRAKMIDFVEHQYEMIEVTKGQCALIQIKTSPQGTQTFDLPDNLKRQTGPDKARKDSYSALVLGNWMTKIYFDMQSFKGEEVVSTFTPMFIS
ncbi:MAG: terminase large subunit domain-containing protein [Paracoccaceae bacterium]